VSLLDRLFETPESRGMKRLLDNAQAQVEATYGPLMKLAMSTVVAAQSTQDNLAKVFHFSVTDRPSEPQMLTLYELLYFFAHLTLRTAVGKGFSAGQVKKLQGYLGPLLASTAVDSFCLHWPEDIKAKIRGEFYEKLNDAEAEYAECHGLISSDDPLDRNTLIGRLATNCAQLWERSDRFATMAIAYAAIQSFKAMELEKLVDGVAAVIDSVDSELLERYWEQKTA